MKYEYSRMPAASRLTKGVLFSFCIGAAFLNGGLTPVLGQQLNLVVLAEVSGEVSVVQEDTGESFAAEKGLQMFEGYSVTSGINGNAVLVFSNGSTVTVRENTHLLISQFFQDPHEETEPIDSWTQEPGRSNTVLNLDYGKIVGSTRKLSSRSIYRIETPVGIAGIRGTDWFIEVAVITADVLDGVFGVTQGLMEVTPLGARFTTIGGNQQVIVNFRQKDTGIPEVDVTVENALTTEQKEKILAIVQAANRALKEVAKEMRKEEVKSRRDDRRSTEEEEEEEEGEPKKIDMQKEEKRDERTEERDARREGDATAQEEGDNRGVEGDSEGGTEPVAASSDSPQDTAGSEGGDDSGTTSAESRLEAALDAESETLSSDSNQTETSGDTSSGDQTGELTRAEIVADRVETVIDAQELSLVDADRDRRETIVRRAREQEVGTTERLRSEQRSQVGGAETTVTVDLGQFDLENVIDAVGEQLQDPTETLGARADADSRRPRTP